MLFSTFHSKWSKHACLNLTIQKGSSISFLLSAFLGCVAIHAIQSLCLQRAHSYLSCQNADTHKHVFPLWYYNSAGQNFVWLESLFMRRDDTARCDDARVTLCLFAGGPRIYTWAPRAASWSISNWCCEHAGSESVLSTREMLLISYERGFWRWKTVSSCQFWRLASQEQRHKYI